MEFNVTEIKELNVALKKAFDDMQTNIAKTQDVATQALQESQKYGGVIEAKTADMLKQLGETGTTLSANYTELKTRMTDVEQKLDKRPSGPAAGEVPKTPGQIAADSEEFKVVSKDTKARGMAPVTVGSFHGQKALIVNATGQNQPLVPTERVQGLVTPGLRRMTVRDLLPQSRTQSNLIEFAKELVATNNAGPQWDASSPTPGQEGAVKSESGITFEQANAAVSTLAHWIPASRQVLADALAAARLCRWSVCATA
jgi:HK97 family phage major capsid protein